MPRTIPSHRGRCRPCDRCGRRRLRPRDRARLLAEADIAAGRVKAFGESEGAKSYWLVAPVPQWRQKKVKALVTALLG
jgi:hypothetical protein